MTCRGVRLFEGSQEAGRTLSGYISLWLTAGLCTTILAVHPGSWRGVHEGEDANQGKSITELCCRRRTRLASRGKGCAQDRAHVWHAALRLGGREGSGEEAVRPCCARNARTSDWVCRDCAVMSLGRGLASAASHKPLEPATAD